MPVHTRLARATQRVQRRVFLKALGLGVSVPVAAQLGKLATAQDTGPLKRLMVLFFPHGIAPEHFNPRLNPDNPTDFALDQTNVSILGPLEPYKNRVTVLEGFQYIGDGQTHDGSVNFLSGYEKDDDTAPRTTMEHVIGNAIGVEPLILGACGRMPFGLDRNSKIFWNGSAIDPEKDPSAVADRLFGGSGGDAPEPGSGSPNVDAQLRNDLLALTEQELEALHADLGGLTSEQSKLQTHLESVRRLKSTGGGQSGPVMSASCSSMPSMPLVEQVRAASAGQVIDSSGGNDYFFQEKNFPLLYQAQLQLAAEALICGAAPIIGLQPMYVTCDFDFGFANAPGSHHNTLSHVMGALAPGAEYNSPVSIDNFSPTAREAFGVAQRWFFQQLVDHVVSVLATTDDPTAPGTTVLDNTIILTSSEISDGANHLRTSCLQYPQVPTHLPFVAIGGGAGAIKTGQVVSFPVNDKDEPVLLARPATDLYLTLAQAMGVSGVSFPNTTGIVSEVLA